MSTITNTTSRISPAERAASATLSLLYAYRVALYDALQAGCPAPLPPALSADALVDAYGAALNRYGAPYVPFAEWIKQQQMPQEPRTFVVVGEL